MVKTLQISAYHGKTSAYHLISQILFSQLNNTMNTFSTLSEINNILTECAALAQSMNNTDLNSRILQSQEALTIIMENLSGESNEMVTDADIAFEPVEDETNGLEKLLAEFRNNRIPG